MKRYSLMIWIAIIYLVIVLVLTALYDVLPIVIDFSLYGLDSFYASFITNMHNSVIDFIVLTIIFTILVEKLNKRDTIRTYKENIDDCRFWYEAEAGFKIAGNIRRLQNHGVRKIDLSKIFLVDVILKDLDIGDSKFMGSTLSGSNFEKSKLLNCDFQGAYFERTILRNSDISHSKLRHIKASNSNWIGVKALDCDFDYADFSNATLKSAIMKNSSFRKVVFKDCNLERANLLGSKNIDVIELCKCKSLKYTKLDEFIIQEVQIIKPSLMQ